MYARCEVHEVGCVIGVQLGFKEVPQAGIRVTEPGSGLEVGVAIYGFAVLTPLDCENVFSRPRVWCLG